MKNTAIKHWSEDERPREKLINNGASSLSDAELLAIIINHGTRDRSALELARDLLNMCQHDWNILSRKSFKELQKINGIGPAKAIGILATLEISNRKQIRMAKEQIKSISSSRDAAQILSPLIKDSSIEIFYVLYLDQRNAIIHQERISTGGVSATHVDVRLIMKTAVEHLASGIILSHNHPSGNLTPSESDKKLTQQIKDAGLVLNVRVLDHLIITQHDYLSFSDEGIL